MNARQQTVEKPVDPTRLNAWSEMRHNQVVHEREKLKEALEAKQLEECTFAPKTTGGKLNASGSKFLNRRKRQELEPGRTDESNSAAQTRDPHGAMGLLSSSDLEPIVPQTVPVVSSAPLQQLPSSSQGLSFNDLSRIVQEISPRASTSPRSLTSNYASRPTNDASSSSPSKFDFASSSHLSNIKLDSSSRVRIEDDVESVEESAIRPAVRQPSNHDAAAGGGRKKKVLFQADVQDNRPDSSQSSNFDDIINIEPTISNRTYRRLPTAQLLDETTIGTRVTPDMDDNALVDAFRKEIDELRCERDLLLDEKRAWLEQLKNENAVMMLLLQDSKTAKERLLQELDLVEKEKDKLRSREMDEIDARFDELLSSTPLGEQSRANLPPALRSKADEVHKQLCMQAIRCHANQRDLIRYVLDRVHAAETFFLNNLTDKFTAANDEVRTLSSLGPTNIAPAKEIAKGVYQSISRSSRIPYEDDDDTKDLDLDSSEYKLDVFGNVEILCNDANPLLELQQQISNITQQVFDIKQAQYSFLNDDEDDDKQPTMEESAAQAQLLRQEALKIRGEYEAELSYSLATKGAAERLVQRLTAKNEALKNNLSSLKKKSQHVTILDATDPISTDAAVTTKDKEGSFDELPSFIRTAAWRELTLHCRTIVTSHVLAAGLDADVLEEISGELALNLRDALGSVMWSIAGGPNSVNTKTSRHSALVNMNDHVIRQALAKNSPLEIEANPLALMFLTFVHERYKSRESKPAVSLIPNAVSLEEVQSSKTTLHRINSNFTLPSASELMSSSSSSSSIPQSPVNRHVNPTIQQSPVTSESSLPRTGSVKSLKFVSPTNVTVPQHQRIPSYQRLK